MIKVAEKDLGSWESDDDGNHLGNTEKVIMWLYARIAKAERSFWGD